ncbi:hypothetical protein DFH27DRAFT_529098 [Peziza echinospora]|nr:hypothetical protein DFH27DRAFT_529098 [Peziza echinospora]
MPIQGRSRRDSSLGSIQETMSDRSQTGARPASINEERLTRRSPPTSPTRSAAIIVKPPRPVLEMVRDVNERALASGNAPLPMPSSQGSPPGPSPPSLFRPIVSTIKVRSSFEENRAGAKEAKQVSEAGRKVSTAPRRLTGCSISPSIAEETSDTPLPATIQAIAIRKKAPTVQSSEQPSASVTSQNREIHNKERSNEVVPATIKCTSLVRSTPIIKTAAEATTQEIKDLFALMPPPLSSSYQSTTFTIEITPTGLYPRRAMSAPTVGMPSPTNSIVLTTTGRSREQNSRISTAAGSLSTNLTLRTTSSPQRLIEAAPNNEAISINPRLIINPWLNLEPPRLTQVTAINVYGMPSRPSIPGQVSSRLRQTLFRDNAARELQKRKQTWSYWLLFGWWRRKEKNTVVLYNTSKDAEDSVRGWEWSMRLFGRVQPPKANVQRDSRGRDLNPVRPRR